MKGRQIFQTFLSEESGATSTECAALLALLVVVVMAATALLGGRLNALTANVTTGISNTGDGGTIVSVDHWTWATRK